MRRWLERKAGLLFAVLWTVTVILGIYGQHRIDAAKQQAEQQQQLQRLHKQEARHARKQANGGRS